MKTVISKPPKPASLAEKTAALDKVLKREHPGIVITDFVRKAHIKEIEKIVGKPYEKMSLKEVRTALDELTSGPY